jgi:hypothetical protein
MHYITRINFSKLDEDNKRKLKEALEYCKVHDKFQSFEYRITGETIRILSPDIKTAKKRGYYFKKKFDVYFNILIEQNQPA